MRYLDHDEFYSMQTKNFLPLRDIVINTQELDEQLAPYKQYFRNWGVNHLEKMFRQGIPLVNGTGNLDDEVDPTIWPLDQYNREHGTVLRDNHFTTPTPILDLPCFDSLAPIKPYMLRSSVIWWKKGSFFFPHIDSVLPTGYIRLWGTNKPENYLFSYLEGSNHTQQDGWDEGQIYLCDTVKQHYAEALADDVYTYFFCLDSSAYDVVKELSR